MCLIMFNVPKFSYIRAKKGLEKKIHGERPEEVEDIEIKLETSKLSKSDVFKLRRATKQELSI